MRAGVAIVMALLLWPLGAHAHGREVALGQIAFHPNDPDHVVVRTTWGFLTTRDGGETFTWQCAAAVPFDRTREDPSIAMTPSGALLAGTFDGLTRSDGAQCAWSVPSTAPTGGYVTDVVLDPSDDSVLWSIISPGVTPDVVHRSEDEGLTWAPIAMPDPRALTDRIRVAPSDPMRVYTSGVIPAMGTEIPRQGVLLRSDDRGMTWRAIEVPLLTDERIVHVLAVDPSDPDRIFARAVRRVTDMVPERLLLSTDGGMTWSTSLELVEIVGFAMSADGQGLWAGSWDGGLHRSRDGGETWELLDDALRVRCLAWRPGATADGELWVCADGFTRGFALGRSTDGGGSIEPLWTFGDIVNDVGCDPSTPVGELCPMYFPDIAYDLQLDGAVDPYADAGVSMMADGGPGETGATGCGCRAGGGRPGVSAIAALAIVLVAIARRRRD